ELDLIALGPSGVHVIEVKHWDPVFLSEQSPIAEKEADKLNMKVRRLVPAVRRVRDIGFLAGKFLLTKGERTRFAGPPARRRIRGVDLYGLVEWKELLEVEQADLLDESSIRRICETLQPRSKIAVSGDLRSLAGLTNLELISVRDERFHRI